MKKGKIRIGCVVDYIVTEYTGLMVKGASRFCAEHDAELVILPIGTIRGTSGHFTFHTLAVASHINTRNLDGIIFPTGTQMFNVDADYLKTYIKSYGNVKLVSVSFPLKGVPSLVIDCEAGFRACVEHLVVDHGYKKFAFMTVGGSSLEVENRNKIFFETLEKHGISKESVTVFEGEYSTLAAHEVMVSYLKSNLKEAWKPDFEVIVALNDEMAFGCIQALREFGLKVPKDVAVTGFDSVSRASYDTPTLTSVSQETELQGYKAASMVYDMIVGKTVNEIEMIPSKCCVRQSCGCDKDALRKFSNQYVQADFEKSEAEKNQLITTMYLSKERFINAGRLFRDTKNELTIDELKVIINNRMRFFGIKAAAVVLYNNPIDQPVVFDYFKFPKEAYVFSAFDDMVMYEKSPDMVDIVFDPNNYMLPPGILSDSGLNTVVYELYSGSVHYGYLVYKIDSLELESYDFFCSTLSNILVHAYGNSVLKKERNLMNQQYNQMKNIAVTDELTGLRNRRGFMELSKTVMTVAQSMNQEGLIVFCDMDGLKKINDNFGHDAGDEAIKAEADILKASFGEKCVLGRIGGDEFAALCVDMTMKEYQKIKKAVDKRCADWTKKNNSPYTLSISMGVQTFPSEGGKYNFRILLTEADAKLYIEKHEKQKNGVKAGGNTSKRSTRFKREV